MDLHPYLEPCTLPSPKMWYVVATSGEHPAVRVGHACIHIPGDGQSNGYLCVTGGANPSGTFSDTFCLDLDSFTWQKYPTSGFVGRYEHTVFRGRTNPTKLYIFGGADCNGNRNDVQEFNVADKIWSTVETTGTAPPARTFHNGACIGDRLIVYGGGERGSEPVSDKNTYAFEITERRWTVLKLRGDAPKPRHGHLMVAVGNRLFLHGGMSGNLFFDDLHILDLDRNSWSCAKVKSIKPSRRAAHGGFVYGTNVLVFGGMNSSGALSDSFTLNTDTMQWTAIELCGSPPESRLDFATCTLRLRLPSLISAASSSVSCSEQSSENSAVQHSPSVCESGDDLKAAGDAHIIDVTGEFTASHGIIDTATDSGLSDAEHHSASEPAACIQDAVYHPDGEVTELGEAVASVCAEVTATAASSGPDVEVAMLLGGMDTNGEIFNDCLVYRLSI